MRLLNIAPLDYLNFLLMVPKICFTFIQYLWKWAQKTFSCFMSHMLSWPLWSFSSKNEVYTIRLYAWADISKLYMRLKCITWHWSDFGCREVLRPYQNNLQASSVFNLPPETLKLTVLTYCFKFTQIHVKIQALKTEKCP